MSATYHSWAGLLATAGVGALLGYALAATQSRAASRVLPLPQFADRDWEEGDDDDEEEYEDCKMILVVRQVHCSPPLTPHRPRHE